MGVEVEATVQQRNNGLVNTGEVNQDFETLLEAAWTAKGDTKTTTTKKDLGKSSVVEIPVYCN